MANEITINASLQFAKGNVAAKSLSVQGLRADVAGTDFVQQSQTIPTTAGGTPIQLGDITLPGVFLIKNNDPTNYVEILPAHSGDPLLQILPGEVALGRFAAAVTAPEALAHTASVAIEYLIIEA